MRNIGGGGRRERQLSEPGVPQLAFSHPWGTDECEGSRKDEWIKPSVTMGVHHFLLCLLGS